MLALTVVFDAARTEHFRYWRLMSRDRTPTGRPLVRVVSSLDINRPPELVWRSVADYGNDTSWRAGVIRLRPSRPGPTQVGTTTHETLRLLRLTLHTDASIDRVEAGRLLTWHAHDRQKQLRGARLVEPTGPGSNPERFTGWIAGLGTATGHRVVISHRHTSPTAQ